MPTTVTGLLPASPKNHYLRTHHVARICGVSNRAVRTWAQTGRLPAEKHGPRIWFFKESDVLAFLHQTMIDRAIAGLDPERD
jgi:excisionase family DNA binding protein